MSVAIRVENLGKQYRVGQTHAGSVRELLSRLTGRLRRRPAPTHTAEAAALGREVDDDGRFWAVRDVSFEVKEGEIVGIIGRNGSGKSTLLKLLSQITTPTTGRVELYGRVASLLEVGTGFHPELTGRENIFLNGAILGMTRTEIRSKLDEIVTFAELGPFLDTPVKRYSSGMYMRLAFAVAAHLEPEILLVDEVLAVGDALFQNKCLGKMSEISRQGRTVLFVSHNMAAVSSLCERAIWLVGGTLAEAGSAQEVVRAYLVGGLAEDQTGVRDLTSVPRTIGDQRVRFTRIQLRKPQGEPFSHFHVGEPIEISLDIESSITGQGDFGFTISTLDGFALFTSSSNDCGRLVRIGPGEYRISCTLAPNPLRPGKYRVHLGTTFLSCRDYLPEAFVFEIVPDRHHSGGQLYHLPGHLHFPFEWSDLLPR